MPTIGPNPTLIRLDYRPRPRKLGEADRAYWRRVARTARAALRRLLALPEYRHAHRSFAVRDAMLLAERQCETGTFGVERIAKGHNQRSPAIEYLNAGDTYATTLLYVRGRFRVGCWGDIVERGNYD